MARCNIGNHGLCSACQELVDARQRDHLHIYRDGYARHYDVVCAECWLTFAVAAAKVLKAIRAAGITDVGSRQTRNVIQDRLSIGVQLPLGLGQPNRN